MLQNLYLPLNRDLNYIRTTVNTADQIYTQSGEVFPALLQSMPLRYVFHADQVKVTDSELQKLQHFYRAYHGQKFRFQDPHQGVQHLNLLPQPDGIITQFSAQIQNNFILYFPQSAQVKIDEVIQHDVQMDDQLNVIFNTPPLPQNILSVDIEFDYAVMFDYSYGLRVHSDPQGKVDHISFKLVV